MAAPKDQPWLPALTSTETVTLSREHVRIENGEAIVVDDNGKPYGFLVAVTEGARPQWLMLPARWENETD